MVPVAATLSLALLFAAQAQASCGYGTRLHPRKEGTVEVNEFGYVGLKVSSRTLPESQPTLVFLC